MAKLEGIKYDQAGRYKQGRGGQAPEMIVVHWSAGWGDAEEIGAYFRNPKTTVKRLDGTTYTKPRDASYHIAIGRDGTLVQMVDTEDTAWHAGGGRDWDGRTLINARSIGVSFANRGPLYKDPKWTAAHPDKVYTGYHTKPGFRGYKNKFEVLTEAQIEAFQKLCVLLTELHPSLAFITGHEDLVHGKGDPGPVFADAPIEYANLKLVRQVKDWRTGLWHQLGSLRA